MTELPATAQPQQPVPPQEEPPITTVGDLVDALTNFDEDLPVALAVAPNYPMKHAVGLLAESDGTVYVGVGPQEGYLPADAAERLCWHQSTP